jgi:pimeloyl-ACP methyl ester carboxylesterase
LADHHFYKELARKLENHFNVYNLDRRGRGQSTDTVPYSVEREVEDILAVMERIGEPVILYGHSAGSALAIRVASVSGSVAKLVISDPPFTPQSNADTKVREMFAEEAKAIQVLNQKGDHKGAAAFFLRGFGLSAEEVNGILSSPVGEGMIECARSLPYDYAVLGDGMVPDRLVVKIAVPTLILAAEAMPDTALALSRLMPNSRFQPLDSSVHESEPGCIAEEIVRFAK